MFTCMLKRLFLFGFLLVPFLAVNTPEAQGGLGEGPPSGAVLEGPVIKGRVTVKKPDANGDTVAKIKGKCIDPNDPTERVKFRLDVPLNFAPGTFPNITPADVVAAIDGQVFKDNLFTLLVPPHPCWNGVTLPPSFVAFILKVKQPDDDDGDTQKIKANIVLLNFQ